ncbi:Fc.00g071020.m01.CDS01 [Cosmosporella sp. VM-42]
MEPSPFSDNQNLQNLLMFIAAKVCKARMNVFNQGPVAAVPGPVNGSVECAAVARSGSTQPILRRTQSKQLEKSVAKPDSIDESYSRLRTTRARSTRTHALGFVTGLHTACSLEYLAGGSVAAAAAVARVEPKSVPATPASSAKKPRGKAAAAKKESSSDDENSKPLMKVKKEDEVLP